jgi:hypothetical protein
LLHKVLIGVNFGLPRRICSEVGCPILPVNEAGPRHPYCVREEFWVGDLPVAVIVFRCDVQSLIVDLHVGISAGAIVVVVLQVRLEDRVRK